MSNSGVIALPYDRPLPPLKQEEFQRFKSFLYENYGIDLREGKEDLVSARLGKKVRELGLRSFSQYFDYVTNDREGNAVPEMVDLLTTNHTSFFRESVHFDLLRRLLPEFAAGRNPVRIWSAACSSGEEPYSIGMAALDLLLPGRIQIVATDISNRVLKAARDGVYAEERVKSVPAETLRKYFLRGEGKANGFFRVKPTLASQITFERLNLMERWSHSAPFSMIWCRNVMIYFDKPTQARVVNQLAEWLESGGYLFIGHSEALNGIQHPLRYIQPAVYRKP